MIARYWSAQATRTHASSYADHLRNQVLPALRKVDGYSGAMLLQREISDGVEIIVITLWRSLDSVREFAGADLEQAVVSDEAASFFMEFDRRVRHYELVTKDGL